MKTTTFLPEIITIELYERYPSTLDKTTLEDVKQKLNIVISKNWERFKKMALKYGGVDIIVKIPVTTNFVKNYIVFENNKWRMEIPEQKRREVKWHISEFDL